MKIKERLAMTAIIILHKFLLYILGYDKLIVYIGDSDDKDVQFSVRRYYMLYGSDIIQVPVTAFYDMEKTMPPEMYLDYMKQFEELCKNSQEDHK